MPYILESMTASPVALYSLRKMIPEYSDKAIKVRRSSDNAEQDIAFDTNSVVSANSKIEDGSTSFSSWYGSDSVYVINVYDQMYQAFTTANKKFGNKSAFFNGSKSYVAVADSPDFAFGSNDFTIEGWFKRSSTGTQQYLFAQNDSSVTASTRSVIATFTAGNNLLVGIFEGTSLTSGASTNTLTDTTEFHHIAVVRNGNTLKTYVDGNEWISTSVTGKTVNDSAYPFTIGRVGDNDSLYFNGNVDEFRISNNARYTSNFTPPTTAFTDDANTVLLLHMETGIDSSSKNHTVNYYRRALTQLTSNSQPRIVNAGTIDVDANSNTILELDGGDSFTMEKPSVASISVVQKTTDTQYTTLSQGGSNWAYMALQGSSITSYQTNFGTPAYYKNGSSQSFTNRGDVYTAFNDTYSIISIIGCSMSSWSSPISVSGFSGYGYTGQLSEIIMFSESLSDTDRRLLETNQGDYYGITVANPLYPVTDIEVDTLISDVTITATLTDIKLGINVDSIISDGPITSLVTDVEIVTAIEIDTIVSDIQITALTVDTSLGINVDTVISDVAITALVADTVTGITVDAMLSDIPVTAITADTVLGITVDTLTSNVAIDALLANIEVNDGITVNTIIADVPITALVTDVKLGINVDTLISDVPATALISDISTGINIDTLIADVPIAALVIDQKLGINVDALISNIEIIPLLFQIDISNQDISIDALIADIPITGLVTDVKMGIKIDILSTDLNITSNLVSIIIPNFKLVYNWELSCTQREVKISYE